MSNYIGDYTGEKALAQQLTELLMEKGCTVNKGAIRELVDFIALRDQQITDKIIQDVEKVKTHLDTTTRIEES